MMVILPFRSHQGLCNVSYKWLSAQFLVCKSLHTRHMTHICTMPGVSLPNVMLVASLFACMRRVHTGTIFPARCYGSLLTGHPCFPATLAPSYCRQRASACNMLLPATCCCLQRATACHVLLPATCCCLLHGVPSVAFWK